MVFLGQITGKLGVLGKLQSTMYWLTTFCSKQRSGKQRGGGRVGFDGTSNTPSPELLRHTKSFSAKIVTTITKKQGENKQRSSYLGNRISKKNFIPSASYRTGKEQIQEDYIGRVCYPRDNLVGKWIIKPTKSMFISIEDFRSGLTGYLFEEEISIHMRRILFNEYIRVEEVGC